MVYPVIPAHRMAYDVDGTEVGVNPTGGSNNTSLEMLNTGMTSWLTAAQKIGMNSVDKSHTFTSTGDKIYSVWFFFPELRNVTHLGLIFTTAAYYGLESMVIQGSTNSTNGINGTWDTATFTRPAYATRSDYWRSGIFPVTLSGPVKVLRVSFKSSSSAFALAERFRFHALHLYGSKAVGETPDDIIFCDNQGVELAQLIDFGDRPEGTTAFTSLTVRNSSPDKIANLITMNLTHDHFLISFNPDGPWTSTLSLESLGPNGLSPVVHIKNELPPPLLVLGPQQAKLIVQVGSWT